jgi:hypothetical protein
MKPSLSPRLALAKRARDGQLLRVRTGPLWQAALPQGGACDVGPHRENFRCRLNADIAPACIATPEAKQEEYAMSSNYIHALAQRHAAIERRIEDALKSPAPDTLYITSLKKLRLAYRDRIREAIRQKRARSTAARQRRWPPAATPAAAPAHQLGGGH